MSFYFYSVEAEADDDEHCIWFDAANSGDLDRLKELVLTRLDGGKLANALPYYKGRGGQTVFHFAATAGRMEICKYFVEELKLNIDDFLDNKGHTPLHSAIIEDHYDVAVYLLDHGANSNAADNVIGATPLYLSVKMAPPNFLQFLISKGAEIDAIPNDGSGTPLQLAAYENFTDNMKVLLDNHANPNGVLHDQLSSPLYLSIVNGSIEFVKLLLQAGADPNLLSAGHTPLGVAAGMGEVEVIKCLLNAGADPDVPNHVSYIPIEFAALLGRREAVRCLLPATSRISTIKDWSVDGILNFFGSNEATKKMKKLFEGSFLVAKCIGEEAFKRNDYYTAIGWYSQALTRFPTDPATIHSKRSLCWIRLIKGNFALEDAKCCIRLRPDWPEGYHRLGEAWMQLKNYKDAAAAFSHGCDLDPGNDELQNALKQALEGRRKFCGKQTCE
ncbi:hypothetical protein COLO4_05095 [Corchorus olitorius]|uniref:Tetratricopeptide TPR-1 n=1 Tax=Corchorus olitorius TaxID=93759 RepID=A0A1R3KRX8_9ROSI|nr:hypothetical protein COLO4_05095 [Corchorus olitorius]